MGLGHIKPGITAAQAAGTGIFHPTMTHPKTGEPLEAVYVTKRGVVMWPVMGASPDDDSNDDGGDDDDGDDDKDDDDDDDSDDDNDGDDTDGKKSKAKIKALEEEKDRHYKRRKKAETERDAEKARAEKAEAELAKLKGKKPKAKPADDKKDDDADDDDDSELEAERAGRRRDNEQKDAEIRKGKIEVAFLRANTVDWHNASQVMALLMADDDYEVEFDDNGNVDRKSLSAELKRFAKANPHLVKPKAKQSDADGDKGEGGSGGNSGNKSGSAMNGQRKGKKDQAPSREELAKKYPALRR